MATQTIPTPANMDVVLASFVSFAVANAAFVDVGTLTGVTIDIDRNGQTPTAGSPGTLYRLLKNGMYFHFGFTDGTVLDPTNGNCLYFAGLMAKSAQTQLDASANLGTDTMGNYADAPLFTLTGPYENAFLYAHGDTVMCVLEITPNVFTHFGIGVLSKFGSFSGGEFLYVSSAISFSSSTGWDNDASDISPPFNEVSSNNNTSRTYIYLPSTNPNYTLERDNFACVGVERTNLANGDQFANGFVPWTGSSVDNVSDDPDSFTMSTSSRNNIFAGSGVYSGRQVAFNRTVTFPGIVRARNIDNPEDYLTSTSNDARFPTNLLGLVEGMRVVNMYSGNPKDLIDTNWRIFPIHQKSGSRFSGPVTGELGLAYLEA